MSRILDGFLFVADSSLSALHANLLAMKELKEALQRAGLHNLPHVIQYNKRDVSDAVSTSILREHLNCGNALDVETVANQGQGVVDGLIAMTKMLLRELAPTV